MAQDPTLLARLYDYLWALVPYWWIVVTGFILALEPLMETILSVNAKKRLDNWLPKERRVWYFRAASVLALFLAGFFAYDDISAARRSAIAERDAARKQYTQLIESLNKENRAASIPSSLIVLAPDTPEWIKAAHKEIGVKEIPGPEENKRIVEYFKTISPDNKYRDDIDDWASAFVEWSLNQAKITGPKSMEPFAWLGWGQELQKPAFGCVVILSFSGLHHVGFYFGDDGDFLRVLGGNESDEVRIYYYPKTAVFGYRWPPNLPRPNGT